MPRRASLSSRLGLLACLALLLGLVAPLRAAGQATTAPAEAYRALIPGARAEIAGRFDAALSRYTLDVDFRPDHDRLTGTMTVDFVNATGTPLREVAFRLYPNARYYGEGYLAVTSAEIDGAPVTPVYASQRTAMRLPLGAPLLPGGRATITLAFRVVVPDDSRGTYGIFNHDTTRNAWVLADWYPILAGWDPARGWRLDPPTSAGDPTFADAALYDLTLTLPADLPAVTTGDIVSETPAADGRRTVRVVTGPARDLTLVADPELAPLEAAAGATTVRVWAHGDAASQAAAAHILELAVSGLALYGDRYGAYLYDELDLVATPIAASVLGISWTGLVMLNAATLFEAPGWLSENPEGGAFAVLHEIGHQWWGGTVGSNSNDHPFMVEGLTNALTIDVVDQLLGPDAAQRLLASQIVGLYRHELASAGDGVVDTPVGQERPGGPGRVALAYGKGALGFLAIRAGIGDDAFFAALRGYAARFLFANSEPADLRAAFAGAAPAGSDVAGLWTTWFERAVTTTDDVDAMSVELDALLAA